MIVTQGQRRERDSEPMALLLIRDVETRDASIFRRYRSRVRGRR